MADFREQSTDPGVKPASTAAVAADLSLVVALSPNSPLPSGTNTVGNFNFLDADIVATGTITTTDLVVAAPAGAGAFVTGTSTSGSYVFVAAPGGDSAWNVQITGLTSGTLYFEGSLDSTTGIDGQWINVNGRQTGVVNTVLSGNATTNGMYRGNTSGIKYWRIRSVGTLTGTPAIVVRLSGGVGAVFLNASIPAGTNVIGKTSIDQTTPGTTNLVALSAETTKVIGTVNQAALTKGTQGATGVMTQDLKDSGRSARTMTLDGFAIAATTETIMTMSYSTDNGTLTTGTSYQVTAGKRLRMQQMTLALHTTTGNTTGAEILVRVRALAAGTALVGSPRQAIFSVPGSAAANMGSSITIPFPDGWEFVAATGIAITAECPGFVTTTSAPKLDITVTGFEY